jgi:pimeloyl-ACP methyl ester carboxylesterase
MMLSYQTIGHPSDTPLVFLHGLGAGSAQTTSAFPDLPDTFLIAPDMPGHGQTQPNDTTLFSFNTFADATIELLDYLGIESCNIGGLSMGSGITLNLALRYPQRVKKIILLRPSWTHIKQPDHLKLVAYVGQWIEQSGPDSARTQLHTHPCFQQLLAENPPVANSIDGLFQRPVTPASTAVLYKMWQDAPFSSPKELESITHPILVLTTSKDELHPQSTADLIASHLPNVISRDVLPPRYHKPEAYGLALNTYVQKFLTD